MKKRKTKIEQVSGWYTANGVPLDYAYWTVESDPPCPECGSKLIFDDNYYSGDDFCPSCNKYLFPKCDCGQCSSDDRQDRPIILPEFRQKIVALEKQESDHLEWMQGRVINEWVASLLNRIEVFERRKYLSPKDQSLITKQSSEIEQVMRLLGEGKNELPSLLYFKAAMKIIIAELEDSLDREVFSGFLKQVDTLIQNETYTEDADFYGTHEYQNFYKEIVTFYYPEEVEYPDDGFDSIYLPKVEEREEELNQKLEDGWEPKMKDLRSSISKTLNRGGDFPDLVQENISLSDFGEFIDHLIERQKLLDSEILSFQLRGGIQDEQN